MQAMTTTPQTITDPSWYVNYGVTLHLNSNINSLNTKNPCNGEDKITIGNGINLSQFASKLIYLNHLLHVLSITKNLLNVSKFAKDNVVHFEFFPNFCYVKDQASKEILMARRVKNGLHVFDDFTLLPSSKPLSVPSSIASCELSTFSFHNHASSLFQYNQKILLSLCIHMTKSHSTYILVYVDDILITSSSDQVVMHLITSLNREFALKDLGEHTTEGIHLSQGKYLIDLLRKTKMQSVNPISTPMTNGQKLSGYGSELVQDVKLYTPEMAYSVNKVCQYMQAPLESRWKVVKRILRYLKGTLHHELHLRKSSTLNLVAFHGANWAFDPNDQRSTSGFCVYFGSNLVTWQSKKQYTLCRSCIEAEYKSLASLVA
ncbi:hypothetical protein AAG906_026324 [Vitis piasezkii]